MKESSFISEHSAEFVLVSQLTQLFADYKEKLTPLFFWKSREGSSKSKSCDPKMPVRIIAMYARRPKILVPDQDYILVKINNILFERAYYLKENGIPTIVGVPRISSITKLNVECSCSWFTLCPDQNFRSDVEFRINIHSDRNQIELPDSILGPLEKEELLKLFQSSAFLPSWREAIQILRSESHNYRNYFHSFYWPRGIYKPVYFISWQEHI